MSNLVGRTVILKANAAEGWPRERVVVLGDDEVRAPGPGTRRVMLELEVEVDVQVFTTPPQHKKPCHDCPWRRVAVRGWLGRLSVKEWLRAALGESRIDCHEIPSAQCAGAATFRANICKRPRDPEVLLLLPDKQAVFAMPKEFEDYHAPFEVRR